MSHAECRVLFEAGIALVERSGLASYCGAHFVACDDKARFDECWREEFHPEFGRYMVWVLFSVGAENLAKAACVCNGLTVHPKATLRAYTKPKGYFEMLCKKTGFRSAAEATLLGGYECLTRVRNRDAHSYRKDVRDAQFPLVKQQFVPAFDILVEAMRHCGHQLPTSR